VIGRGAYGEIWLARSMTGALRAVKVVYRATFESERAFQREFQGMSSFEPISRAHAGFVDILHVGQTHDYLYYIMELADDHVAGRAIDIPNYEPRTLKSDLARHHRLSAGESIQLGLSLTEALETLHASDLTHRDIKPSNIIFIDGVAKLADIGLVAATGQRSFVGTEGYVPPEGPGTPQADVFSLGKLLYEVSTGKDRLDFPEVDSQLTARPDRQQLLQLNEVLLKACANKTDERYKSAAEMHNDLAALARGEEPRKKRSRLVPALAALLFVIAGSAAIWLWTHQPSEPTDLHLHTTIRTEPAGAMVILGDYVQKTPATFNELEPRKYKLEIRQPGYEPVETILDLSRGRSFDPPIFHFVRSKGGIQIESQPAGAQISLQSEDGQIRRSGVTPEALHDLPTGKYSIIAKRGDWELRDDVEVKRNETERKTFAFVTAPARVISDPPGAEISIDGAARGKTPLQIDLAVRKHDLVAHIDGWQDEWQELDVQSQRENSARFVFGNGSVKITSAPGSATVVASGRELGQTPLVIEEVKPGPVKYELRLAGYKTVSVEGRVEPQQQAFLAARLEKSAGPAPGQAWTNSLGMKFVSVGDIRMSIWETRVQDYDAFVRATGHHYEPADFAQGPTHPVVKVNWFDANAFCKWLTDKEHDENLLDERQIYRLPTDLEWSTAVGLPNEGGSTPQARDGKIKNEFPWGKQWPPPSGAGNYADRSAKRRGGTVIENYVDNFPATSPVGSFKPNASGIHDLGGNVWEWCADSYKGSGGASVRDWGVLRGGSWATSNRGEMQSSYRNVVDRNERDVIYGFRCVLTNQSDTN
jgi:formylglycine-generating enzyme required for sulfatase activity/serine/threonine protein kinase